MENNSHLDPKESLSIMEKAIRDAQIGKNGAAYYLILWGALFVLFFTLNFVFEMYEVARRTINFLYIIYPLGGILSFLHSKKTDRVENSKPLNDKLYLYTWAGAAICLGAWYLIPSAGKEESYTALLLLVFGFAAFITGGVTAHRLSLVGGVISIVLAGIMPLIAFPYIYLIAAIGVGFSTLIPGLHIKTQQKK